MDLKKLSKMFTVNQEPKKYKVWAYQIPMKEHRPMMAKIQPATGLPLVVYHEYEFQPGDHKGQVSFANGTYVGIIRLTEAMTNTDLVPSSCGRWLSPEDPDPVTQAQFKVLMDTDDLTKEEDLSDDSSTGTQEVEEATPKRPRDSGQPGAPLKRSRMVTFANEQ